MDFKLLKAIIHYVPASNTHHELLREACAKAAVLMWITLLALLLWHSWPQGPGGCHVNRVALQAHPDKCISSYKRSYITGTPLSHVTQYWTSCNHTFMLYLRLIIPVMIADLFYKCQYNYINYRGSELYYIMDWNLNAQY